MVSIIITSYNKSATIRRAINSAINQTYKNCEVIVVDDCSTDNSHDIYREFADKIKLISTPNNCGVTYAREEGIQAARGKYLTFLDADDYLDITAIQHCVSYINKTNADIVQMKILRRFPQLNLSVRFCSKYKEKQALEACLYNERLFPVQCCGKLYKADLVNKVSPIYYSGYWGDDRVFNIPIMYSKPKIAIAHKAKYNYTWGGFTTSQFNINAIQEYKEVYKIKHDWAMEYDYEFYIPKMQDELVSLLKYHIRRMLNSGAFSKIDIINYLIEELSHPFWREFNLNTSAEKAYKSQKYSLVRIIKKICVNLIS